jgi:hypothetical protein
MAPSSGLTTLRSAQPGNVSAFDRANAARATHA